MPTVDAPISNLAIQIAASTARHALTALGGSLAADGILSSTDVPTFVGAGLMVLGVAWAWWQKVGQAAALAELNQIINRIRGNKAAQA